MDEDLDLDSDEVRRHKQEESWQIRLDKLNDTIVKLESEAKQQAAETRLWRETELRKAAKDRSSSESLSGRRLRVARSIALYVSIVAAAFTYFTAAEPELVTYFFTNYRGMLIPGLVGFIGFFVVLVLRALSPSQEGGFVSIDLRAEQEKSERLISERIEAAIKGYQDSLRGQHGREDIGYSADDIKLSDGGGSRSPEAGNPETTRFESYIAYLVRELDFQITTFDKKASELLDTGIRFLLWGILAYIASIVIWQVALKGGYVGEYAVVGMISCTLTFLVVEFLAAWFLRQYKGFVESSLNIVKARSLFNRYMLSYHAIKEFSNPIEALSVARSQLLKVLEETVKWPEASVAKAGDLNHMVAMFESVSKVIEAAKSDRDKTSSDKKKASPSEATS